MINDQAILHLLGRLEQECIQLRAQLSATEEKLRATQALLQAQDDEPGEAKEPDAAGA